jgi:hypothetical protein
MVAILMFAFSPLSYLLHLHMSPSHGKPSELMHKLDCTPMELSLPKVICWHSSTLRLAHSAKLLMASAGHQSSKQLLANQLLLQMLPSLLRELKAMLLDLLLETLVDILQVSHKANLLDT